MNTPKLRALTLHPEWAWAILNLGKDVENRPERVAKMVLNVIGTGRHGRPNDWLAIHAGKQVGGKPGAEEDAVRAMAIHAGRAKITGVAIDLRMSLGVSFRWKRTDIDFSAREIPKSAIVALTRVRPGNPESPWAVPGQAQIGLRDLFVLPEPVPCSGKQGLWIVSDEVAVKVLAQVKP